MGTFSESTKYFLTKVVFFVFVYIAQRMAKEMDYMNFNLSY